MSNTLSCLDVTVVMPAFNRSALITRALDSILNQTSRPSQVIVVDDASDDDTVQCVRNWSDKNKFPVFIEVLHLNGGAAAARNRGIALATTRYIAFLDSDDEHVPTTLEFLVRALELMPDAVVSFGDGAIVTSKNIFPNALFQRRVNLDLISEFIGLKNADIYRLTDAKTTLLKASIIPTSATCFHRSAALAVGGMPEEFRTGEDWLFWLRLSEKGSFVFYINDLALHYRHENNLTDSGSAESISRQKLIAFAAILDGSFKLSLSKLQLKYIKSLIKLQISDWRYQLSYLGLPAYIKGIRIAKIFTGKSSAIHVFSDPKSLIRATIVYFTANFTSAAK